MPHCAAFGCHFQSKGYKAGEISLHSFPRDVKTRKVWERACGRTQLPKDPRLCSQHFSANDFEAFNRPKLMKELLCATSYKRRLKPDALPSLFPHKRTEDARKTSVARSRERHRQETLDHLLHGSELPAPWDTAFDKELTNSTAFTDKAGDASPSGPKKESAEPNEDWRRELQNPNRGGNEASPKKQMLNLKKKIKDPIPEQALSKVWSKQVRKTRLDWKEPSTYSVLCSEHFTMDCFEEGPLRRADMGIDMKRRLVLKKGSVPTIFRMGDVRATDEPRQPSASMSIFQSEQSQSLTRPAYLKRERKRKIKAILEEHEALETGTAGESRDGHGRDTHPVVCEMCGTTGDSRDFFSKSKRFCQLSCARAFSSNSKRSSVLARLKGKSTSKKHTDFTKRKLLPSASTKAKNKNKVSGFDWGSYLEKETSVAASVSCFRHAPLWAHWDDIVMGMKVEILNTNAVLPNKVYWIATVIQVAGYKALLRYEGFEHDSSQDFWCSLVSGEMNPIGWCAMTSKLLVPPQDVKQDIQEWKEYLMKKMIGASTLPVDFYTKLAVEVKTSLKVGMLVEMVDPEQVNQTCIAAIDSNKCGRLHLVCQSQNNLDLWCHIGSPLMHPLGWSRIVGHPIRTTVSRSVASNMMKSTSDDAVIPFKKHRIVYMAESFFEEGMKVETIDPLHLGDICVATVKKVLSDGFLMLAVDGPTSNSSSGWFCYHASSHAVLPINFCQKNNIPLTVPPGYDSETFCWENYLMETKSKAASARLMNSDYPGHGFYPNMKLEAADLMEPRLVCVATIKRCAGRLLLIHFDGWENEFDQWVDYDSPDIYPAGWCELAGFELQLPPGLVEPNSPQLPQGKKPKAFIFGKRKKKYARKMLVGDETEGNAEHHLHGKHKKAFQDLLPKMSANTIKDEPEEQQIIPVQVKVEEMETSIEPQGESQNLTVKKIKQENVEEERAGECVQHQYTESGSEGETQQHGDTHAAADEDTVDYLMEQETTREEEGLMN